MAHVNKQVRDAVAAALGSILATVSTNRAADLFAADLPAGVVGTATDAVEPWSKGPPLEELRTIELAVVVVAEGESDALDDDLDELRVQIEPAVLTAVASIARHARHTGGEIDLGSDEEGERWFAFLSLSWEIEIVTAVGDPETALLS